MRLLHTSDWHLGKKLEQFSRLEEQKLVMQEICLIADKQKVDVILIAGDIFDNFNPPVEAIELFYHTLKTLSNNGKRLVVVIAGNHDSPDRIEAPDPLARELGIVFIGYPNTVITPFTLKSGISVLHSSPGFIEFKLSTNEKLRLLTTPYANELRFKQALGLKNKQTKESIDAQEDATQETPDSEQELHQLLKNNWKGIADKYCDNTGVNVLLAHLFMCKNGETMPKEPDDEKPILHIGGAQAIYTQNIPSQIQYTALGHLHRKQIVEQENSTVVYCGTPIAYSFSEANQQKFVAIVDIEAGKKETIKFIELSQGKKLLRQNFSDVASAISWLKEHPNTLVEITLSMQNYLTTNEKKSLYENHDGIINIIPQINSDNNTHSLPSQSIDLRDNISDLFTQYFQSSHADQLPNEEILDLFNEIIATPVVSEDVDSQ